MFKKISFVTQPTRSPDLNVLDLGIWNSLQSGVPTIKYDKAAEEPMNQRIIEKVEHMWDNYEWICEAYEDISNSDIDLQCCN
jgi:hypothetical protein